VERGGFVGAEVVLHEDDLAGLGEMLIGQLLQKSGIIDRGMMLGAVTLRQPSSGANSMNRLAVPLRAYS
jgi:hypothetical protein